MLERLKKSWRGKRKYKGWYVVIPGEGPPCPRCGRPMQIREHERITKKHLRQPYYFSRWFRCMHRDCATKLVIIEEFKVSNVTAATVTARHYNGDEAQR
jgi:hypothetical protein